jgi:hypothetical protein
MQSTYQQINTEPGRTILLVQPQSWTLVSVTCDTVGPAIVGSSPDLHLGTGQGILVTPTPRMLFLEPGDALYVFSETTDRISVAMHPMSWIGALLARLGAGPQPVAAMPQPVKGVELAYPKPAPTTAKPVSPKKVF